MKVRGPGSTKGTSKTDKKSGSSASGGASFDSMINTGSEQAGGLNTTQSIAQLDALLAVQEAEDPTARRSRGLMQERGDKVLDLLDGVRLKMLGGDLTLGDMVDVADVVASHREKVDDPVLTDIMDEIDLRAQVEVAKMRYALDKQQK